MTRRLASTTPSYVIGSGWWSSDREFKSEFPKRKELGDSEIRSVGFFDLWLATIKRISKPQQIVVIDSNAPCKPDAKTRAQVQWFELPFNARHSTDHPGQWCGWTWSVVMSANYAMTQDCDYYVYVEQDCLLRGDEIIERCISEMKTGIMFGAGAGTPQPIQQSFFIIRKDMLERFIQNLCALHARDEDLAPEWKFVFATWRPFVWAANLGLLRSKRIRKWAEKIALNRFYDVLPLTGGRTRPLPLEQTHYYFQHGTAQELSRFVKEMAE